MDKQQHSRPATVCTALKRLQSTTVTTLFVTRGGWALNHVQHFALFTFFLKDSKTPVRHSCGNWKAGAYLRGFNSNHVKGGTSWKTAHHILDYGLVFSDCFRRKPKQTTHASFVFA